MKLTIPRSTFRARPVVRKARKVKAETPSGWPGLFGPPDKYRGRRFAACVASVGKIPVKGSGALHLVSRGEYDLDHLIAVIGGAAGPVSVVFSTWVITRPVGARLLEARRKGYIEHLEIIHDARGWGTQAPNGTQELVIEAADRFTMCATHAKVLLVAKGTRRITITSSANMSQNPRIENHVLHTDPELYRAHKSWMDAIHDKRDPFASKGKLWKRTAQSMEGTKEWTTTPEHRRIAEGMISPSTKSKDG